MLPKHKRNKTTQLILTIVFVGSALLNACTGMDPLEVFGDEIELSPVATTVPEAAPAPAEPTAPPADDSQPAPSWWEVYFTDPLNTTPTENLDGTVAEVLIAYIEQAQVSIHIAAFEFNLTPVAEALIAAHERGVDVRWITDDEHGIDADEEEDHGQFALLEDVGIPVIDDGRSALMHNKFIIIDSAMVWTGSTNLTHNGVFKNNNNVIVIHDPAIAAIYAQEFAEMWAGEFGPRSPSTLDTQEAIVDETFIRVLFSAEDEVVDQLVPILENAQESIYFMAFSFTHDDLGAAMLARAEAGVLVSGIFETRGSQTEYSELTALYCAEQPVRQDGNPRTFHHKVIIIDGETVITGSLNFSNNANDSNDENVLIIQNADIAAQYIAEFERRWAEAEAPDPADLPCE